MSPEIPLGREDLNPLTNAALGAIYETARWYVSALSGLEELGAGTDQAVRRAALLQDYDAANGVMTGLTAFVERLPGPTPPEPHATWSDVISAAIEAARNPEEDTPRPWSTNGSEETGLLVSAVLDARYSSYLEAFARFMSARSGGAADLTGAQRDFLTARRDIETALDLVAEHIVGVPLLAGENPMSE